ncbi:MAG: DUF6928 family protein [Rhodococcus sp. (in: high G+C Gram-positive bacteria)]|uniref:DUF6928 family protein n=1 Tax=Rhodococcus TaxID=1827 RepID=UPI001E4D61FA|nr:MULTISPECIES: hypothetical protein [Rhodococcus]BDB59128.1 hypothetical protein RDE2_09220 [Rhodococcus sp. RDE2]
MSATVSTLWYVDAPDPAAVLREFSPDRDAAQALLSRLFPDLQVDPGGRVPLAEAGDACEDDGVEQFRIGSYPGVTVVSSPRFALRHPSELPAMWLRTPAAERTCLLASDPAGAWGSFAVWECGTLRRSFGANTVEFFEDQGLPFVWERPFWAGEHPLRWPPNVPPPPESLPFHPRKLVEEAHGAWLGFRYVGRRDDELDPRNIETWSFTLRTPVPQISVPAPKTSWWRRLAAH